MCINTDIYIGKLILMDHKKSILFFKLCRLFFCLHLLQHWEDAWIQSTVVTENLVAYPLFKKTQNKHKQHKPTNQNKPNNNETSPAPGSQNQPTKYHKVCYKFVRSQRIVVEYNLKIWFLGTCEIWFIELNIIWHGNKLQLLHWGRILLMPRKLQDFS